jgi:hypothetical protein
LSSASSRCFVSAEDHGKGERAQGEAVDFEEEDNTDDKLCTESTSAGSSLLTVKPCEMTAHARGVWVDVTTEDIRDRGKRRSESMSATSHGEGIPMSIIELMHEIVKEPAPRLSDYGQDGQFPMKAVEFVDACLLKDPEERKMPGVLLVSSLLFCSEEID